MSSTVRTGKMQEPFILLIADRNRHVRDFLRREFMADGYVVELAKNDRELLYLIECELPLDLLIFDLEMPYDGGPELLEQLQENKPLLPVVIHTFLTECAAHEAVLKCAAFIEKSGQSIDLLKQVVEAALRRSYPNRFSPIGSHEQQNAP
jgi:DNA-binding NtrC family response regulator